MIEQFLNRDYLLAISAAVAEGAAAEAEGKRNGNGAGRRRGQATTDPLAEVAPADLDAFAEAVREVPELKPVLRRKSSTRPPPPRQSRTP